MQWYTIQEFETLKPIFLYRKEKDGAIETKSEYKNLHVLCRASYSFDGKERIYLKISADDVYKLYINGEYCLQGPAIAWESAYYYQEVEITKWLKPGVNVIAAHLYYQGEINRYYNSGDQRCGIAAELLQKKLEQTGENSREEVSYTTPLSFVYRITHAYFGELIGYDTQYLENFDSRLWENDWNLPVYDDRSWKPMVKAEYANYQMIPQETQNLSVYKIEPKLISRDKNTYFVDIGEEITGSLWIKAKGKAKDVITILCGEELCKESKENEANEGIKKVRYKLRANCTYKEIWTLDDGVCVLDPFDYKGFRYANLLVDEGVKIEEIKVIVRHYPMKDDILKLNASDKAIEDIFHLCKNTVKYGTQEGYVDCPTREKGQYLGDAFITAHAQVLLTDEPDMMKKCLEQFMHTSKVCPGLLSVTPGTLMQEVADFSLLFVEMAWQYFQFTKDIDFLKQTYLVANQVLIYFRSYEGSDGLLDGVSEKWNLVDWPENLRDDYDFELSRPVVAKGAHVVLNAHYLGAIGVLSLMEEALNMSDTLFSAKEIEQKRNAYLLAFYRPKQKLFADSKTSEHTSLHANIYSLYYGLSPKEATLYMCDFFMEKGFDCGVMTSYFMLKALARAGEYEKEYQLLMNDSKNSWKEMLREGATTCMEVWQKDQKWNTSLCHPWACAPIAVLVEDIAGFCPDAFAKEGFSFTPHIPKELERFCLEITYHGKRYQMLHEDGVDIFTQIY